MDQHTDRPQTDRQTHAQRAENGTWVGQVISCNLIIILELRYSLWRENDPTLKLLSNNLTWRLEKNYSAI